MTRSADLWRQALACLALAASSACGGPDDQGDRETVILWKHQVGELEEAANSAAIERFNQSQDRWFLDAQSIPQGAYPQSIMAAAMAGAMPCILTVDHPMSPGFVWAGHLRPLDDLVDETIFHGVSSAAIGRYDGRIYSVGQFDAALALFARRSVLQEIGARVPTIDNPWTRDEFDRVLSDIMALNEFEHAIDLATRDIKPDWWTYAFSPVLQGFGADLIDRETMTSAEGVLNGEAAQEWGAWFQSLFENGYVSRKEPDDRGFIFERVALNYTGNWWALEFSETFGDDLLILPPPDFGEGVVIGGGSWQWGISRTCENPEAAAAFIEFLMRPAEIAAISEAAGMVPVTEAGAALTTRFRKGGDWRIFFELMTRFARQRPATPAFTAISNAYYKAARDIMNGKNVRDALDDAVDDIDRVIEDNNGFRIVDEDQPA